MPARSRCKSRAEFAAVLWDEAIPVRSYRTVQSPACSVPRRASRESTRPRCCVRCVALPRCLPRRSGGRDGVTSACSGLFLKPVRSATEGTLVPSQLPVHLPGRELAAGLGLGKPPICVAARHGRARLTCESSPRVFASTAQSPMPAVCGGALPGAAAVIHRAVSGRQRGPAWLEVRPLLSQLLCCWPRVAALADLVLSAVPSTRLKKLGAGAAALPGDPSLAVEPLSLLGKQSRSWNVLNPVLEPRRGWVSLGSALLAKNKRAVCFSRLKGYHGEDKGCVAS